MRWRARAYAGDPWELPYAVAISPSTTSEIKGGTMMRERGDRAGEALKTLSENGQAASRWAILTAARKFRRVWTQWTTLTTATCSSRARARAQLFFCVGSPGNSRFFDTFSLFAASDSFLEWQPPISALKISPGSECRGGQNCQCPLCFPSILLN